MLSTNDNALLTRVGPGTLMGELMRRFWLPALLEEEVAIPDGAPVRLRLLGEDLVAFRDTQGRVGIVEARCAHRRAGLFFGRNEEGGLRCAYHGWKYDVTGQCVDLPTEPRETNFREGIRLTAYPSEVRGGVVWIYMGPSDLAPALPDFEFNRLPRAHRVVTKRLQQSNWAQAAEGGIDSSHLSYLHDSKTDTSRTYLRMDRHPVFDVKEIDHGLMITARRNADPGQYYWRINRFLPPFYTLPPTTQGRKGWSPGTYKIDAWVPIDDENTWNWAFVANPDQPYSEAERDAFGDRNGFTGPLDEHYRPLLNRDNDYRIDRERQKNVSYSGIEGVPNQDAAMQESMGPIVDRTRENLGNSDLGIVHFRRMMLRLAGDLADGRSPHAAANAAVYNVRPAEVLLPDSVPVLQGAADLLRGSAPNAAK